MDDIEIMRLRTAREYAFGELAALRAEVERLKAGEKVWREGANRDATEIERLTKQCEGLHQSAMNNGQDLLLKEAEIERLKALIYRNCNSITANEEDAKIIQEIAAATLEPQP